MRVCVETGRPPSSILGIEIDLDPIGLDVSLLK